MSDVEALAERVNAMPPPERLRFAAGLLEQGKGELAHAIVKRIADELGLAIFLADARRARVGRAR